MWHHVHLLVMVSRQRMLKVLCTPTSMPTHSLFMQLCLLNNTEPNSTKNTAWLHLWRLECLPRWLRNFWWFFRQLSECTDKKLGMSSYMPILTLRHTHIPLSSSLSFPHWKLNQCIRRISLKPKILQKHSGKLSFLVREKHFDQTLALLSKITLNVLLMLTN